jgi:hypothetical protein
VPLDAEASRRLAQQRIGFFAGVFLSLSVAFFLRNAIAIGVLSGAGPPLSHPAFLLLGTRLEAIEIPAWTREQGDGWWRARAPTVLAAVKQLRSDDSTPRPPTIAVELERRTPASRHRQRAFAARSDD